MPGSFASVTAKVPAIDAYNSEVRPIPHSLPSSAARQAHDALSLSLSLSLSHTLSLSLFPPPLPPLLPPLSGAANADPYFACRCQALPKGCSGQAREIFPVQRPRDSARPDLLCTARVLGDLEDRRGPWIRI
jgi:hypothetical protein